MPPSLSELPEEVRAAFFVFEMLSDRWDGAAGYYLGKDITPLPGLYEIFDIEHREVVTQFVMHIQKVTSKLINEEVARRRKMEERKHGK